MTKKQWSIIRGLVREKINFYKAWNREFGKDTSLEIKKLKSLLEAIKKEEVSK